VSENSKIQWTDHTFNPWWGCTKVHAGCKNCYAETLDKRFGPSHWGNNPRRMVLGEWSKPEKWNRDAERAGVKARVFCASMCDLFEDYSGPVVNQQGDDAGWSVDALRRRVFKLIGETPWLEWLLLTKRPEEVNRTVPIRWHDNWPSNVMVGTSPCNQETAEKCIPELLKVPGRRFLSCEPLLGPIDFSKTAKARGIVSLHKQLHWVIVGGESGHNARVCDVGWILDIVKQCKGADVPVFVKQLGSHVECANDKVADWMDEVGGSLDYFDEPSEGHVYQGMPLRMRLADKKGGNPDEWPADLRVREFPKGAK